ncbi:MAG TPA: FAD:protein FMN transferase [Gaiellales bacterium]|jgi:thiamine biosynthesis lipoprotein
MLTLLRHRFDAMGTECSVAVTAPIWAAGRGRIAIAAALVEVAAQERSLSRFDPGSDLTALNARAGGWHAASERLYAAVEAAVRAREATGGRYDPTVLPALIAAGYDGSYRDLHPHEPGRLAGWRAGAVIELDPAQRRIRLAPGTSVDLGGIGKGMSAAVALDAMRDAWPELPGALVDLGGDIAVTGSPPDRGAWRIDIADPRARGRCLGTIALATGGVASSGRDRRRLGRDGAGHHLIDPRTGGPAVPGPLAVTVIGPGAGEAEAHATALAITPTEQATFYLAPHPRFSAIIVPSAEPPFTVNHPPLVAWAPDSRETAA